jgi:hypothetical protein
MFLVVSWYSNLHARFVLLRHAASYPALQRRLVFRGSSPFLKPSTLNLVGIVYLLTSNSIDKKSVQNLSLRGVTLVRHVPVLIYVYGHT